MDARSRAKSLPALRQVAEQQARCASTVLHSQTMTPQTVEFPIPKSPIVLEQISVPAWDREIDIVFSRVPTTARGQAKDFLEDSFDASAESEGTSACSNRESPELDPDDGNSLQPIREIAKGYQESVDERHRRITTSLLKKRPNNIEGNNNYSLLVLPENVRRKIWGFVMATDPAKPQKPIRIQSFDPFYKGVWEAANFQSTRELFTPCSGAVKASASMRADCLAYLLTSYRFHLVFSPFVTQKICPQLFHWIDHYSHLMEYMTIEIDLSKLGFGASPEAQSLSWGLRNILISMRRFVTVQSKKRVTPHDTLVIIARRYHGRRPTTSDIMEAPPYCPPEADFTAATPLLKLRGQVKVLRLAGFNTSTTNTLITSIFPNMDFDDKETLQNHCSRSSVSTIWPFIPGQVSIHQEGKIPKDKLIRAVPLESITPTKKVAMAKKHIEKLKEMLDVHDPQKRGSRQTSSELDRGLGTLVHREVGIQRRRGAPGLARLGDNMKPNQRRWSKIESPVLSPRSPMLDARTTDEEKRQSYASFASTTPSIQIEDMSDVYVPVPGERDSVDKINANDQSTQETTPTDESKRYSQASTGSLRSTRSLRWLTGRRNRKDSARSSKDTSTVDLANDEHPVPKALEKKDSVKRPRRKRSFIDALRGRERSNAHTCVAEPELPDLSKVLYAQTQDKV
ncbi:hypothetical protein G7054_g804 [Neopestalotiopsis clavispora]|nr:hypothetical protein G7054_g804 [Neopestalotiopsis clavispora]